MNDLKKHWADWQTRFSAMARREKLLVFATVMLVILLGGWQFQIEPLLDQKERTERQITAADEELMTLRQQQDILYAELSSDPDAALRQQERQLSERLRRLDSELEALTTGLIGPEAMVDLLQAMLSDHDGVQLQGIQHEAPQAVSLDGRRPVDDEDLMDEGSRLYAHGVTVRISGDYMAVLQYLEALESLDDRLGWQGLDYEVKEWPRAEVRLRLQTLSLHKEWLGV